MDKSLCVIYVILAQDIKGGVVDGVGTEICRTPRCGVWRWQLCVQHDCEGFSEVNFWEAPFHHPCVQHLREVREVCWC